MVERAAGPVDKNGKPQFFDRLVINSRSKEGRFRVLLIPFRMGDEIPRIIHAPGSNEAILEWNDQRDLLKFQSVSGTATLLGVTRDGKGVL